MRAELVLPALAPKGPVRLRLFAGTYLNPGRLDRQRVRLSVNHRLAADWLMKDRDFAILETTVPRDYFGNEERTVITIETPDATSPNSIGDGNDLRRLGLVVGWLSLGE